MVIPISNNLGRDALTFLVISRSGANCMPYDSHSKTIQQFVGHRARDQPRTVGNALQCEQRNKENEVAFASLS